jgi:excisionase family DNA binding protein
MPRLALAEPLAERKVRPQLVEKLSYTVDDIALRTHLEKSSIWERISEGRLPAHKDGGRTLVLHDDLIAYLRSLPKVERQNAPQSSVK